MNLNHLINNVNLKKVAVFILLFLAASIVVREIIFWNYFREFQQTLNHFNDQFTQDQKFIHNKILESENDRDKWKKEFDEKTNEFHNAVDKGMQENLNFMENSRLQMRDREDDFDKKFREMPGKMWQAHQEIGKEMRESFKEDRKKMDKSFSEYLNEKNKEDKIKEQQYKLQKEAKEKKTWEAARERYYKEHGVLLPN